MKKSLLLLLLFSFTIPSWATHNIAGNITYRCIGGYQYEITVTTYTKASSQADRCGLTVYFGDGDSAVFYRSNGPAGTCDPPATAGVLAGNDTRENIYQGIHAYPGQGAYFISMTDPNRNGGIQNIPNSVNTPFVLQAYLKIDQLLGTNNYSPQFLNRPLDPASVNRPFMHNPGIYEPDGDSIVFRQVNPIGITGYSFPSVSGGGTESLDPRKGDYTWTPSSAAQGEWNVTIKIEEWRCGVMIGYVMRDMEVTVASGSNIPPVITPVADAEVIAGNSLSIPVSASDPDMDTVTLSAMGEPFLLSSPAVLTGGNLQWTTSCADARKEPYIILLRAEDDNSVLPLTSYKGILVTVKAPAVTGFTATAGAGIINLSWTPAACGNLLGYNIYRNTSGVGGQCDTNTANYSLYFFLSVANSTGFTDYNPSQQCCYMVVPVYSNGCGYFEGAPAYTSSSTTAGMNDVKGEADVQVYPNPSAGVINITIDEAFTGKNTMFVLYNDLGELVRTIVLDKPSNIVDVSEQAAGLYWYRIEGQEMARRGKIMIVPGQ